MEENNNETPWTFANKKNPRGRPADDPVDTYTRERRYIDCGDGKIVGPTDVLRFRRKTPDGIEVVYCSPSLWQDDCPVQLRRIGNQFYTAKGLRQRGYKMEV